MTRTGYCEPVGPSAYRFSRQPRERTHTSLALETSAPPTGAGHTLTGPEVHTSWRKHAIVSAETTTEGAGMAETGDDEDIKAKMRAALERKHANDRGVPKAAPTREKARGSEVVGGTLKMHRRKAGGGGS